MKNKKSIGFGPTVYEFPVESLFTGKKPELCKSTKLPRGSEKDILVRDLRPWQKKAFENLLNKQFQLIKAFCGSGKTTLAIILALWDLINNKRKQLVIVPQSHIGDGFCISGVFNIPGLGGVNLGKMPTDLCDDSDKKVAKLIAFLRKDFKYESAVGLVKVKKEKEKKQYVIEGDKSIFVATHQCFAAAFNKITQWEEDGVDDQGNAIEKGFFNKCFSNFGLTVDEAHHIKSGNSKEEVKEEEDYNRLGIILANLLERRQSNNIRICLTTATFYRGDQGIIVSSENLQKFEKFQLDFLEHFKTLGIENVFVNFEEYAKDPIEQIIQNIESELDDENELNDERHLIVVPTGGKVGAKWRKTDIDLSRLIKGLREMLIRKGRDPDCGIILNLVNKETQKRNKQILLQEPKERYEEDKSKNSKVRIVITCMLGREGTDWCPCSRLHNASIELGSTTLAVQTLGRLFRKFEGKKKVGITYYIKNFESLESSSKKREYITFRVNAMLGLMLIDDLFHPIMLPELPVSSHEGVKRTRKKNKLIRLSDVYKFEDFENIKHEISLLQSCQIDFEEKSTEEIIKEVISKYNKKAPVDDSDIIAGFKTFLLRAKSETLRSRGIDISYVKEAGFDKIVEEHKLGGTFWSGRLTVEEFRKFKDIVGKIYWSSDQYLEMKNNILTVLTKKNGTKIIESNKNHEKMIRKTVNDFCDFHNAYNASSRAEGSPVPTQKAVAEQLKISISVLQERVRHLNQIAPKGYKFFDKKSKITEKFSPV